MMKGIGLDKKPPNNKPPVHTVEIAEGSMELVVDADASSSVLSPKKESAQQHKVAHQAAEEVLQTAGQRRVNILWEGTQACIALAVTGTGMYTAARLALENDANGTDKAVAATAFLLISNAVFLVIGFYFGRTNHTRTGGVNKVNGGEQTR